MTSDTKTWEIERITYTTRKLKRNENLRVANGAEIGDKGYLSRYRYKVYPQLHVYKGQVLPSSRDRCSPNQATS